MIFRVKLIILAHFFSAYFNLFSDENTMQPEEINSIHHIENVYFRITADLKFLDLEKPVTLKDLLSNSTNVLLIPVYFNCKQTCPVVMKNISELMKSNSHFFRKFNLRIVFFSLDEHETPADALKAQKRMFSDAKGQISFLTKENNFDYLILIQNLGLRFKRHTNMISHVPVQILINSHGMVMKYLYGEAKDIFQIKLAAVSHLNENANILDKISSWLFTYENSIKMYVFQTDRLIILITIPLTGLMLILFLVSFRKKSNARED